MFGPASRAGNEVNARIEHGNPRNLPGGGELRISSVFHALPGAPNSAAPNIEVPKKAIALRCPIRDPISVLISVLAGRQDRCPTMTAAGAGAHLDRSHDLSVPFAGVSRADSCPVSA